MPLSLAPEALRHAVQADARGEPMPADLRALVRVERGPSCARYTLVDHPGGPAVAWRCDAAAERPALWPAELPWLGLATVAVTLGGRVVAAWPVDAAEAAPDPAAEEDAARLALALLALGPAADAAWHASEDAAEAAALGMRLAELVAAAEDEGWALVDEGWIPEWRTVRLTRGAGERWLTLSPAPRPRLLWIERNPRVGEER